MKRGEKDLQKEIWWILVDDSGDELKVKFAKFATEWKMKLQAWSHDLKKQHGAVMEVDTNSSKPYCEQNKI